jgi:hypothetical protein
MSVSLGVIHIPWAIRSHRWMKWTRNAQCLVLFQFWVIDPIKLFKLISGRTSWIGRSKLQKWPIAVHKNTLYQLRTWNAGLIQIGLSRLWAKAVWRLADSEPRPQYFAKCKIVDFWRYSATFYLFPLARLGWLIFSLARSASRAESSRGDTNSRSAVSSSNNCTKSTRRSTQRK